MKTVIFGATGIVGKAVVNEALSKGYDVSVLTRDAKKVSIKHRCLHVYEGNVMDRNTVHNILNGKDAVIQTLGIGEKGNGKPTNFVSMANNVITEEMEKTCIKRLVVISVIGAGDSRKFLPLIYRNFILPVFTKWFKVIIDDKNRMEESVKKSRLEWTIVRCTTVNHRPATGKVKATLNGKGLKFNITATDLAEFMINQLTDKKFLRQTPTISN